MKPYLKRLAPNLWILPSALLIIMVTVFPIFELVLTSVSKVSMSGIRRGFIGLDNYVDVFRDPVFPSILRQTAVWTVGIVVVTTIIAFFLAILLNQSFVGRKFVRASLIVPWAVSLIVTAMVWSWILNHEFGVLNFLLTRLGLIQNNIFWLGASYAFPWVMWVGVFVSLPFTAFVILAGLQSISSDLYEAGAVDGASKGQMIRGITLPLLRPALTVSVVINTINVFNSFPIIWSMTRGGPMNLTDTTITYLYKLAFTTKQMGQAAAVSVISFVILLMFTIVYVTLSLRREK
ncbi:carbohydrate ABC transporter permease [Paenibacillus sp. J2TS4]|uniref:carbohydrate ABC transporter permease n=1 Tax=Paenibacillus sp. J2TS4 TaxID=2807194 RepID=UPI001B1CE2EB|nr:sugar ABC transporter permease [Paenibacillus sp. J2TS4]GIP32514.1 ABC transporter permease [Paenibacillus sp. J2TS4]